MTRRYAIYDASAAGADLTVENGGTLLTTDTSGLSISRSIRLSVSVSEFEHRAQFIVLGEGTLANKLSIGLANATFDETASYAGGDANSIGYRVAEGQIHTGGASVETVTAGAVGDVIDVVLRFDGEGGGTVAWRRNGVLLTSRALPAGLEDTALDFVVSLGSSADAGDLQVALNSGRDQFEHPGGDGDLGLYETPALGGALRIADVDFVSAPDDAPANTRWEGVITRADILIDRAVHFWPWGPATAARGSAVSITFTDPDGIADGLLSGAWRDQPASVQYTDSDLGAAVDFGAFVVERCEVVDELTRRLILRDPLAQFEVGLQRRRIRPDAEENARNRLWPVTLGACFSLEPVLLDDLEFVYAVDSLGAEGIGKVRDKGDPLDQFAVPTPDFTITDGGQTITLAAPPAGIVTIDASVTGDGYVPPAPVDAIGGDGNPFAGTIGAAPTNWDVFRANPANDLPELLSGGRVRFHQNLTRDSWMQHQTATLVAGQRYRWRVVVDQIAGISPQSLRAAVLLTQSPNRFTDFARVADVGEHIGVYTPVATHDVFVYYEANNYAGGAGLDCIVSLVEFIELPNVDDTGTDDEVEEALVPLPLAEIMRQAIEVRGQLPASSWSQASAAAIDTASGYLGLGFHTTEPVTVRQALDAILDSYTASVFPSRAGVLQVARLIAPEDATPDGALDAADMLSPPLPRWDAAPGLTRQLGARRNERILTDSDLVTDEVAVTLRLRRKLSRQHRFVLTYGGPLAAGYEHADTAPPIGTRLVKAVDGQAEIVRVGEIYATARAFYGPVKVASRNDIELGDVLTVTYPRWGLDAGRPLLVVGIRESLLGDTREITLWGAAPES